MNELAQALIPQEVKEHKFHMVMLFFPAQEIGIHLTDTWINTRNIRFDNATEML